MNQLLLRLNLIKVYLNARMSLVNAAKTIERRWPFHAIE